MAFVSLENQCDNVPKNQNRHSKSVSNSGNKGFFTAFCFQSFPRNGVGEELCRLCTYQKCGHDGKAIVDLSRVGSTETKSLIMGILVLKLQEHRMHQRDTGGIPNEKLRHVTVLEEALQTLRTFAGRSFACDYIHELLSSIPADMRDRLVGNHMKFHQSIDTVLFDAAMMIFKQPWSSSGRGNFCAASLDEMTVKRLEASVKKQGGFLADIFYHKTLDFAMEFYVFADGNVEFIGYSLFQAEKNGKYVGNMVESQKIVRKTIALAMGGDNGLLDALKEKHLEMLRRTVAGQYCGFVGIDMMVVNNEDHISVHPCVEINFRMNMGIMAMYAYLRPFLFDFLEEEEDSEDGAVWRSSILEPPSLMRERGFHTVLKSRFISIRYS